MTGKKRNQKCVRLSDEVLAIIEQSEGNGFNDKFEKIILRAYKEQPKLEESLNILNGQIEKKRSQLYAISEKILALERVHLLRKDIIRIESEIDELIKDDS